MRQATRRSPTALPVIWLPWLLRGTPQGDVFLASVGVDLSYLESATPRFGDRPAVISDAEWLVSERAYLDLLNATRAVLHDATWHCQATVRGLSGPQPVLVFFAGPWAVAIRVGPQTVMVAVEPSDRVVEALPGMLAELAADATGLTATVWSGSAGLALIHLDEDHVRVVLPSAVSLPSREHLDTRTLVAALLQAGLTDSR